jgi:glycosyltransferase involved in cell wall biosynthesis
VAALEAAGHSVRVLTTPELAWYWRDGEFVRRGRRRVEKHNRAVMQAALEGVDVVSWWGMGGMQLGLIEQVREAGVPAVGVVGDGWMVYGPHVDPGQDVDLGPGVLWLFIAEAVRERALKEGHQLPHTGIAHPGVDPASFPPAPEVAWRWALGCIGRVEERKGIDVAIRALELLPEATLTVDGPEEGSYGEELQALAATLGVAERVRFARSLSEAVAAAYAAVDAVVFGVTWPEPWGLVPLESMSVGRPVIATGTGGSAEYLRDGENCLLVPVGDHEALAGAVRRLADDPALRARLRAGGFKTAARFPADAFYSAVVRALEEAAGS